MGFELSVNPPTCPISAAGGTSRHKITNHTDQRIAYKVRFSNNSNYSANTTSGIIEVCGTVDLVITRTKGPAKPDTLTIQYASVAEGVTDPNAPFASGKPVGVVTGETAVKLSAAE